MLLVDGGNYIGNNKACSEQPSELSTYNTTGKKANIETPLGRKRGGLLPTRNAMFLLRTSYIHTLCMYIYVNSRSIRAENEGHLKSVSVDSYIIVRVCDPVTLDAHMRLLRTRQEVVL